MIESIVEPHNAPCPEVVEKGKMSEGSARPALGAEFRISKMIGHLEELASAQKTFQDACEKKKRESSGGFWEALLFMFLLLVDVAIIYELPNVVPPVIRLGVFVVLLIAAVIIIRRLSLGLRKSKIEEATSTRDRTRESIAVNILTISENYPQDVEAWGGSKALNDPTLVATLLKRPRGQLNGCSLGYSQSSRGGLVLGLGIAGVAFPLLAIILGLGIAEIFFPLVAIIAWAMGASDLKEMEAGTRDRAGKARTHLGKTLGVIATLFYFLGGAVLVRVVVFLVIGAQAPVKDASYYLGQGTAWFAKKDYDTAIRDLDEAIRLGPKNAHAFGNRGAAWTEKREYDKAIRDFDDAIRLDPKLAMAYYNRGNAWAGKNEQDKAIKDYDTAIHLDPKLAMAFSGRGLAWNNKNEFDKALRDCNEAICRDPKLAVAFNIRGYAWGGKGDFNRAITDFDEAIRLDPTFALAINNRGLVSSWKKEYGRAFSDFDASIHLDPSNADFITNLAWLLATCPEQRVRDGNRAIQLATKACELTGWKNYWVLDRLAAAYAEVKQFGEAVRYQGIVLENPACQGPAGEEFRQRLELYKRKKPYRESH